MLVSCPECAGKVSTRATACPHCGAPPPFDQAGGDIRFEDPAAAAPGEAPAVSAPVAVPVAWPAPTQQPPLALPVPLHPQPSPPTPMSAPQPHASAGRSGLPSVVPLPDGHRPEISPYRPAMPAFMAPPSEAESEPIPLVPLIGSAIVILGLASLGVIPRDQLPPVTAIILFFGMIIVHLSFQIAIIWGPGVSFSGFRIAVVGIGTGKSRYGEYFLVAFVPLTGFGAFFRTIFANTALWVLWSLEIGLILAVLGIARQVNHGH